MKLRKLQPKQPNKKKITFRACVVLGVPNTAKMKKKYNDLSINAQDDVLEFIFENTTDPEMKQAQEQSKETK